MDNDVDTRLVKCTKSMNTALTIDGAHDKPYLRGIRCASEMCVDLLGLGLVEGHESVEYVVASCSIVRTT